MHGAAAWPQPTGPLRARPLPQPRSSTRRRLPTPLSWHAPDLVTHSCTKQGCVCVSAASPPVRSVLNSQCSMAMPERPGAAPQSVKDVAELRCRPLPELHKRGPGRGVFTACPSVVHDGSALLGRITVRAYLEESSRRRPFLGMDRPPRGPRHSPPLAGDASRPALRRRLRSPRRATSTVLTSTNGQRTVRSWQVACVR